MAPGRNQTVTGGMPAKPHNHALDDLPLGRGAGRLSLFEPGTNVTFTAGADPNTWVINASGGGGGGALRDFTYLAGGLADVPSEGLYITFAGAHAAAAAAYLAGLAPVQLWIDGSLGVPSLDAGTYAMYGIALRGVSQGDISLVPLTIPADVSFTDLMAWSGFNVIMNDRLLVPFLTFTNDYALELGPNLNLSIDSGSASSMIVIDGTIQAAIYVRGNVFFDLSNDGGHVLDIRDTASVILTVTDGGWDVSTNSIRAEAGTQVDVRAYAATNFAFAQQIDVLGTTSLEIIGFPYQAVASENWFVPVPQNDGAALDILAAGGSQMLSQAGNLQGTMRVNFASTTLVYTALCSGMVSQQAAFATNIGLLYGPSLLQQSGGVLNEYVVVQDTTNQDFLPAGLAPYYSDIVGQTGWGWFDLRFFTGFVRSTTTAILDSDNPALEYMGFSFSSARGDTNFMLQAAHGFGQQLIDTGVTPQDSTLYRFVVDVQGLDYATYRIYAVADTSGALTPKLVYEFIDRFNFYIPTAFTWLSGLKVLLAGATPHLIRGQLDVALRYNNNGVNG